MSAARGYSHKKAQKAQILSLCLLCFFVAIPITNQIALTITAGMVLLWLFSPVDPAITGLAGCALYWITGVVNFETAFIGFSRELSWFVFGATILAAAVTQTGLAVRLGQVVTSFLRASYPRILLAIIITGFFLTFIVPSPMARVVVLAMVGLGVVEVFGVAPKSNISRGLFVSLTSTAIVFDSTRPFLALVAVAVCWLGVLWLYPPEAYSREQVSKPGAFTGREKRASMFVTLAAILWATEIIHHISPSRIGIGVALAACLPRAGIFDAEEFRRFNPLPILFMGAVLSMSAVITQTNAFYPEHVERLLRHAPVLVLGYSYGHFELKDLLKIGWLFLIPAV